MNPGIGPREHHFAPAVCLPLARPRALAHLVWLAWAGAAAALLGCTWWLRQTALLENASQAPGMLAAAASWLVIGCLIWRYLHADPFQSAWLHHRLGAWSLQTEPQSEELPCTVRVHMQVQHWLLLRLKVQDSWHWLWLHAAPPQAQTAQAQIQAQVLPQQGQALTPLAPHLDGSQWLKLRRALVASKARQ